MNNSNNDFHYEEIVNKNIYIAKLLHNLPSEAQNKIKNLLIKKEIIIQKNGLFAQLQIDIINKKINKIREEYNEKEEKK